MSDNENRRDPLDLSYLKKLNPAAYTHFHRPDGTTPDNFREAQHMQQQQVEDHLAGTMAIGFGWRCEKHGHQTHCWACQHAIHQDETKPVGIAFVPFRTGAGGYYLCKDCLKLRERYKFDFQHGLVTTCYVCVIEESDRLRQLNPELVINCRERKRDGKG